MAKLNARQQSIVTSYQAFKGAARGMVVLFENNLQAYWGEDNRDSQYLAFLVNLIGDTPRLQKDVISLIPKYTGCTIRRENGVYIVENNKELTKDAKNRYRKKVADLVSAEWASIQDIDKPIKPPKENELEKAEKAEKRYKSAAKSAIKNGFTPQQLLLMLEEMAFEVEAEEAKAKADEVKQVKLEAAKLEAHLADEEAA